jgi:hypothetical protein
LGAVADEVGAHGKHDVDRSGGALGSFEQGRHEKPSFRAAVLLAALAHEAEQLFELIDEEQQAFAFGKVAGLGSHGANQAKAGAADLFAHRLLITRERLLFGECFGEIVKRGAAGVHDADTPAGGGTDQAAAIESGQEASANQRGLAAAGGAHYGQKAIFGEAAQELLIVGFAAVEKIFFAGFEGAQPGIGLVEAGSWLNG